MLRWSTPIAQVEVVLHLPQLTVSEKALAPAGDKSKESVSLSLQNQSSLVAQTHNGSLEENVSGQKKSNLSEILS